MATIINNPRPNETAVVESDSGGWAVAVIILLAVIAVGGYLWVHYHSAPATAPGTTVNLTLPNAANGYSNTPAQ